MTSVPRPSNLEWNRRMLVVSADLELAAGLRAMLGGDLDAAGGAAEAALAVRAARAAGPPVAVAFVDARPPSAAHGLEIARQIWLEDPGVEVVLRTAGPDRAELGADLDGDGRLLILSGPLDATEVRLLARSLSEKWALRRQAELSLQRLAAHLDEQAARQQQAETEQRQAQKLEAVGRLAAGLAHELNTPLQIAFHSAGFVGEAFRAVSGVLEVYERARDTLVLPTALLVDIARAESDRDLTYLREQAPEAARDLRIGLERAAALVRALKRFSSVDNPDRSDVDLNAALADTLAVSRAEHLPVAVVETDFHSLPPIRGHAGDLNLVFLGLIRNAVQAIGDARRPDGGRGLLRVATRVDAGEVVVEIADSGVGIADSIRERIFEPFFTTREVGRGTGLGLATARAVVRRHGGSIDFAANPGGGTIFRVRLPVDAEATRPLRLQTSR